MTITMDDKQLKRFERALDISARKAIPAASRDTINRAAWETRKRGQQNVKGSMVLKNRWTLQSIRVEPATTSNPEARVGSTEDYMARQEFGGTVKAKHEHHPIPTSYAAGQAREARPRTRVPRKPNRMGNIQLGGKRKGRNRKQRNAIAVSMAARRGQSKFVHLDLGRRQGIFRVSGSRKDPKVSMVWDLSRKSVRTPANPWLKPATDDVVPRLPRYYRDALRKQLRQNGVRGYS